MNISLQKYHSEIRYIHGLYNSFFTIYSDVQKVDLCNAETNAYKSFMLVCKKQHMMKQGFVFAWRCYIPQSLKSESVVSKGIMK